MGCDVSKLDVLPGSKWKCRRHGIVVSVIGIRPDGEFGFLADDGKTYSCPRHVWTELYEPAESVTAAELVEQPEVVVLYVRGNGDAYVVADADEVAAAALQLHDPMSLVRMAVLAVKPDGMGAAIDSLRLAADWLESQIEERRDE